MWAVNAIIGIRASKVLVGDPDVREKQIAVKGPELIFHPEHNLLMYPKAAFARGKDVEGIFQQESSDDDSSDAGSESSEDELSEVDDPKVFQ